MLPDLPVTPTELRSLKGAVCTVTGAGGYLATHLVARLLASGAQVRACVRSKDAAAAAHLPLLADRYCSPRSSSSSTPNTQQLTIIPNCDLLVPGSFDDAIRGAKYVFHTASPFQMAGAGEELLKAARGGTRNVLSSCARAGAQTLERVVLTSSVAALHAYVPADRAGEANGKAKPYTARDWNDVGSPSFFPYEHSKAEAERWAWRFLHAASGGKAAVPEGSLLAGDGMSKGAKGDDDDNDEGPAQTAAALGLGGTTPTIPWSLTTICPGFILGPPLAQRADGESVTIVRKLLEDALLGAWPDVHFGACDARDVAAVHALAALDPSAAGKRLIVAPHASSFGRVVAAVRDDDELRPRVRLPRRAAFYVVLLALSPLLGWIMGLHPYRVRLTYGVEAGRYDCSEAEEMLRRAGVVGGGGGGGGGGSAARGGGKRGANAAAAAASSSSSCWTPHDVTITDMARVLLARGLVKDASK